MPYLAPWAIPFNFRFCNESHSGSHVPDIVLDDVDHFLPDLFQPNIMCAGKRVLKPKAFSSPCAAKGMIIMLSIHCAI